MRWRVLLLAVTTLAGAACDDGYQLQVYESVAAPDQAHAATFYRTYRGAAVAPNHMRVAVRPAGAPLVPEAFVFEMRHGCRVALRWDGPRRLVIAYPEGARIVASQPAAGAVAVTAVAEPMPEDRRSC